MTFDLQGQSAIKKVSILSMPNLFWVYKYCEIISEVFYDYYKRTNVYLHY